MLFYQRRSFIKIFARWLLTVARRQDQTETIFLETRKYMQVYVEHLLTRSFTISHKEIYTLAFQTALTNGRIDVLGQDKDARALCLS